MELLLILIGVLLLVTLFLPWVNAFRFGPVHKQLAELRRDIRVLQRETLKQQTGGAANKKSRSPKPDEVSEKIYAEDKGQSVTPPAIEIEEPRETRVTASNVSPSIATPSFPSQTKPEWFEQNLAQKLPVWIGAVALIFAAFYMVKYSMEAGWLGPQTRLIIGGLFGVSLLAGGQWLVKRSDIPNGLRMAQGLVGAGLVSLFVCLYAAVSLYSLLPPALGFAGMVMVTALAVILSLRHGQPIAAFGLIGGLLTPALVGSPEPNAVLLFTYLFFLFAAMLVVLARMGWWLLAIIALFGVFSWSGIWYLIAFAAPDALILVLFAVAICGATLAVTSRYLTGKEEEEARDENPLHLLNLLALSGAALTILWLGLEVEMGLFNWAMLGLLSAGLTGLVWFRPDIYQRPFLAKLGLDLALLSFWLEGASLSQGTAVLAGLVGLYIALPYVLMRRVSDPRFWAGVQFVAALALYLISYFVFPLPLPDETPFLWGTVALALAGISIGQAINVMNSYQADDLIRAHLIAIYALAATTFISLGFAIELPYSYLPLAFSAQAMATMWLFRRTGLNALKKIAAGLVIVFIALNWQQLALFSNLVISSVMGDAPSHYAVRAMIEAPLIKLGLPALFMATTLFIMRRQAEDNDDRLTRLLVGTTLALVSATIYYVLRDLFHAQPGFFAVRAGFIERGLITAITAGGAIALVHCTKRFDAAWLRPWGVALFHLAMARIVWFDLFLYNPYTDRSQTVGAWFLLNGITLTYGTGVVLAAWGARNNLISDKRPGLRKLYIGVGFAMVFALISLTVRQYFHGSVLTGPMSNAELYTYSVAWLLTALTLLAYGIVRNNLSTRMASLGFMILTVAKVFLIDGAELEGLYRVFSFLGLGVSLIGLSMFYTRFVFTNTDQGEGKA